MECDASKCEKCSSFVLIRNKISKVKYFQLWAQRHHDLHSPEYKLIYAYQFMKNKILLARSFRNWRLQTKISVQQRQEENSPAYLLKNDKRYQEFFHDLQDLALQNAELATKRNKINYNIQKIEEIMPSILEKHKELKNSLMLQTCKNEELIRLRAEKKVQFKKIVEEYTIKLNDASKVEFKQETQNNTTDLASIKNAEDSYQAKNLGIRVRLNEYKQRAIALRNEILSVSRNIKEKEADISNIQRKLIKYSDI
ncbi:hypothetical protein TVAG_291400 [Trichomonas vaginalis G3]|uniref:Uncharacterized protein n=1 Tax=Trichomonas vaginalis (strain ATCC PRA-98 / G3) TaxID=412133 RepID=A2DQS1_TRIV3|nr:hypothetical protein TVAGG3_0937260 [Trichomonas vaginalis G3]EAY17188.1 hypothetical protein TVAG_291400 [Trichomonas vaginalis G3]KAI5486280.1 hypothetical protein TVAGG3_0937260 [Trichomonas vaginalis G3]|eukprot:XP_001329411.1 hypothetical protein [Trichomonas vaginalis G3]